MLEFLERLASGFWTYISRVAALISPFGRGREFFRMGPGLRAFLHIVMLAAILGGLYWANWYFKVDELLKAPHRLLRTLWLPILFLLLYTMTWLGWWLWKLLGPEELSSAFPDIDEAWEQGIKALHDNQMELIDAPLFVVLGKPAGGEDALFSAAQLSLTIKGAPSRNDAPLRFFANRDGIYLTCAGASLIGKQAQILVEGSGDEGGGGGVSDSGSGDGSSDGDDAAFKTVRPGGKLKDVQAVLRRAREEGRELTEDEKGEIRVLMAEEEAEKAKKAPSVALLKNTAEVDRLTARFKHVCKLIMRDRRPYCPINGILLLLPFAASDRDEDASQTGSVIQQELTALRAHLQVRCPILTTVCDLERAPGFREFVERFPSDQRQRRLGQRFPLVPDVDEDRVPQMFEGGVAWMAQAMFPNWIYKLFRIEHSPRDDVNSLVEGNGRLYQLMCELNERHKRLSRLLSRALVGDNSGPPLCSGCYMAATGKDARKEQAFVAGVFRRLPENQDFVTWTDAALKEDSDAHKWATYGYVALGIAAVALFAVGYLVWSKNR
jgi:hypothetical protein